MTTNPEGMEPVAWFLLDPINALEKLYEDDKEIVERWLAAGGQAEPVYSAAQLAALNEKLAAAEALRQKARQHVADVLRDHDIDNDALEQDLALTLEAGVHGATLAAESQVSTLTARSEAAERENEELRAADRVHLSAKQGMETRLNARHEADAARIKELEEGREKLAEFARLMIGEVSWAGSSIDGGDIQDRAEKLGLIAPVPGGYDPDKHGPNDYDAEPGDIWYEYTDLIRRARSLAEGRKE